MTLITRPAAPSNLPRRFSGVALWIMLGIAASAALSGCSSSGGNDKIRIGPGQVGTTTTKAADFPIFYIKRANPNFVATTTDPAADDSLRHENICDKKTICYGGNADLYMRDRAATTANEYNITARVRKDPAEVWALRDVDVSPDGKKVIFAMRGPIMDNQDPKDPPTWNVWEYDITKDDLHRVIVDDVTADAGEDISPHYLPDGHIIFASTRQPQSKATLLDEGKPQFEAQDEKRHESAFVLHIMDADGTNIKQFTFNQSHDMDPTVLSDGRIMFSRWDNAPGGGPDGIHLYTTNPDGTQTQLLYGFASHNTVPDMDPTQNNAITYPDVDFVDAHEMEDGAVLALVRPDSGTEYGGDLYIIDTNDFVENKQPTIASAGAAGPAQVKAFINNVRLLPAPSEGGRFVSAVPLWDGTGRILVAWSQCRVLDTDGVTIIPCNGKLTDPTTVAAPPIYSIWMFDPVQQTMQPVVIPEEGIMMSDVAIAQPRQTAPAYRPTDVCADNPNTFPSSTVDVTLCSGNENVGILDIRSVYDFDGQIGGGITSIAAVSDPGSTAYTSRQAWFLRIEKAVSLPDRDVRDVDFGTALGVAPYMREIVGYIPIEPDGSVKTKVPANVALQIAITDASGRTLNAFPRHDAWISVRPGETLQCNGCHMPTPNNMLTNGLSGLSHGRGGLFTPFYPGGMAGAAFSDANPLFVAVKDSDTMAEARAAWSCTNENCASITPSVNMVFSNVWPSATPASDSTVISQNPPRAGDTILSYTGGAGVPALPTSSTCATTAWSSLCRIIINYPDHIQKIWDAPRNEVTDTDPMSPTFGFLTSANTCTFCHNHNQPTNPAQQPVPANMITATNVAAWQLDLRGVVPDNNDNDNYNTTQFVSYQELFQADTVINADPMTGAITPVTVQVDSGTVDANGNPILVPQKVALNGTRLSSMNAAGSRFFDVFLNNRCQHTTIVTDGTGAVTGTQTSTSQCMINHQGWLTAGELRLITEWVEIGGQYYNDPFKAPVN